MDRLDSPCYTACFVLPSKEVFCFDNLYQTRPKCSGKVTPFIGRELAVQKEKKRCININSTEQDAVNICNWNIMKIWFICQRSFTSNNMCSKLYIHLHYTWTKWQFHHLKQIILDVFNEYIPMCQYIQDIITRRVALLWVMEQL